MSQIRSIPSAKELISPTFSLEIESITLRKGQTALFRAIVNGTSPFEVNWYLGSYRLTPSNRIEMNIKQDFTDTIITGLIDYIISLKIVNCTYQDIGKYTAYVKNEAGDASCSAFLMIEGKI